MNITKISFFLCFSLTWGLGFGQKTPKPDTINGFVIMYSTLPVHDKIDDENFLLNSTIYSIKNPKIKFNVTDNNPYKMSDIKINLSSGHPYLCGKENIKFGYINKIHPNFNLSKKDTFDFLYSENSIVRGTNFTIVAYSLVANVELDEGSYVARKALYTFAVIDKNNNIKWVRDVSIPTNNFNVSYSLDGKFAVIPGRRIEKDQMLNHIYLISLEDKRIVYNFLPNNEESLLYDIQCSSYESMRINTTKIKEKETSYYFFNTNNKTLYKREEAKYHNQSIGILESSNFWDEKTNRMLYYQKKDRLRSKIVIEEKYKKIKTIK